MLGSFYQGHELRALLLFYLLGSIIAYVIKRRIQRKHVAENVKFNASLNPNDWNHQSVRRTRNIEYDWECVFLSLGSGILSWGYLFITYIMHMQSRISKLKPAKWM